MKASNKPSAKSGKNISETPNIKKQQKVKETEMPSKDLDSTTVDPTKPDEETSHRKKHKIGFDRTEEEIEKTDPTKPDEETSHKKKHKIGFKNK